MLWFRRLSDEKPEPISARRQWAGVFLVIATIVVFEIMRSGGPPTRNAGSIMLLVGMVVGYLSGMRVALIMMNIAMVYFGVVSMLPGTWFKYPPDFLGRYLWAWFVLLAVPALVASVHDRLYKSALREWEAQERIRQEERERLRAEGALESSEVLRRLIIDSSIDPIVAARSDGTITLWNNSAEETFGWTSAEVVGNALVDVIIPESYREAHAAGLKRFLETGEQNIFGKRLEVMALTKSGIEIPVELTVVQHDSGEGPIFFGFLRDLTEQMKLNKRLRHAQKLEAVGTLAGGIAHDFNNILAAISGNALLARNDLPANSPVRDSIEEIEKAAQRGTEIVRQILTFSNANEVPAELIDVGKAIGEVANLLRSAVPAGMDIAVDVEPDLPQILANSSDIHQIVLNLGINASHAMPESGGRFEIEAKKVYVDDALASSLLHVGPGRYVQLSCKDNGVGMSPETLPRIFEPFFTTKPLGEGTGLGLAVVYGIVERHKGAITVESEPGVGTSFTLYFPAVDAETASAQQQRSNVPTGAGEVIMYVDDDEALVYMMGRMLRRLNYDIRGFQDPAEAIEAFRSNPDLYDVVITDVSMPGLTGPQLVHLLREVRPDVPIIMVTGYIRPNDLEEANSLGIDQLILKPNTVAEMGEALARVVKELKASRSSNAS